MQLKYFNKKEFECPCGCGKGQDDMNVFLLDKLDNIRFMVGQPLTITSAIRCMEYNNSRNFSPTSSHMLGLAADIFCDSSRLRFLITKHSLAVGIRRIGIGRNFVHLDVDTMKLPELIWLY